MIWLICILSYTIYVGMMSSDIKYQQHIFLRESRLTGWMGCKARSAGWHVAWNPSGLLLSCLLMVVVMIDDYDYLIRTY